MKEANANKNRNKVTLGKEGVGGNKLIQVNKVKFKKIKNYLSK